MNVHRMRWKRCGLVQIHCGEDIVDCLIAAGSDDSSPQNLGRAGIDEDFDEPVGLVFFDGAADARHGPDSYESGKSATAYFGLRQIDMRKGWIDIERVYGKTIADAAGGALEQVVGDDFEIVVGCVREGSAAIAVAQCEDAGRAGLELVVDLDVAVFVGVDPGCGEIEIAGVWHTSRGNEDVRTGYMGQYLFFFHGPLQLFGFSVQLPTLCDETRDASPHHFIEPLSNLNAIDFVKRVFRKGGDVEILSRAGRSFRRGEHSRTTLDRPC